MQADIEKLMARLLTDRALRERFRDDPAAVANEAGLSAQESEAMCRISVEDLFTAARSYEHKRSAKRPSGLKHRMLDWWRARRASRLRKTVMSAFRWILRALVLATFAAPVGARPVGAQPFPTRPIILVVPYAAAEMSTSARGRCRPVSAIRSASRWWSRTGRARAERSPAISSRARRPTGTRCSSDRTGPS
ncbi:MAG TPA: hypothetical protein VGH49_17360, partial [Xanthobacteraceae bacterium]